MWIVKNRKFFYSLSILLVIGSIAAMAVFGLNFGIDFKGGSILEVHYITDLPDTEAMRLSIEGIGITGFSLRPSDNHSFIIRTPHLEESQHQMLLGVLSQNGKYPLEEKQFNSIGPTLGAELRGKALLSIALVIIAIILFITFAFRKVSEPVSSFKYGVIAIVGLIHNVIIPAGVFALLGHFDGVEVDALFVTALLVVLGFSVHDTIVVFDRVRENLRRNHDFNKKEQFEEVVGRSVSQTFTRSVNTSLSVIFTLLALYFLGSESTKWFSLALLIGIIAGTYSSIFIGSPLLVTVERWQNKKLQKGK